MTEQTKEPALFTVLVPLEQTVHTLSPELAAIESIGQGKQVLAADWLLKNPGGQLSQMLPPLELLVLPAKQEVHADSPVLLATKPISHSRHDDEPVLAEYFPRSHAGQLYVCPEK